MRRWVYINPPVPHAEEPFQVTRHLVHVYLFGNKLPTAHTALSAAFYSLQITVCNVAMNKFSICSQWRREVFTIRMLFFSVGNGAIRGIGNSALNAPWCWQLRYNACAMLRPLRIHHVFLCICLVCVACVTVQYGDGWPSWQCACLPRQLSGFESRHLSKVQHGRHKQRSGQHTLAHQKIYQKLLYSIHTLIERLSIRDQWFWRPDVYHKNLEGQWNSKTCL